MKPPTFFNEESTQKLDDHELIVHVWCASSDNDSLVGHVSLETSKIYASLWPEKPHLLKDSHSSPINNFEGDLLKEKRPPDYSIKLITLDVDAINTAYSKFQASNEQWGITGHRSIKEIFFTTPREFDELMNNMKFKTLNCSCLVYLLLRRGGIDELIQRRRHPATLASIPLGLVVGLATATPFLGLLATLSVITLQEEYNRSRTFFTPEGILRLVKESQEVEMKNNDCLERQTKP